MEPLLPITIELPPPGSRRRGQALHQQLRAAILDGRLAPGLALPGTRALALACGVSRNGAVAAYERLLAEGLVTARSGGATQVAEGVRPLAAAAPTARAGRIAAPQAPLLAPAWREPPPVIRLRPGGVFRHDLLPGLPALSGFPFEVWRRLSAKALRQLARGPAFYAEPEGRPALRAAIAGHVSFVRGVACRAEDVLVTAGAQQAFDLLARVLVEPGRTVVAVEEPGYPPLRRALAAAGAVLAPVPVDAQGLIVEQLPPTARLVCVSPSHQFPMGPPLSLPRRLALLGFARRHNAVILEDDYDSEFSRAARPLPALQTLDRERLRVLYVGTFSKSLYPGLRLGFLVAPPWIRPALSAARQLADWHGEPAQQDTLAAFIAEGHLARHVKRMRGLYAERHRALVTALAQHLGPHSAVIPSEGGLHTSALLRSGRPLPAVVAAAAEDGLRVETIARFAAAPREAPQGLVFGLGGVAAEQMDAAIALLARHLG